ncbi:MAG: VanZ family protein, partial [Clostridia bacterium]|nr:VanZ family protein [Clostridia bacterium]
MKEKKTRKGILVLRILCLALALGVCVYIFINSSESAVKSSAKSMDITEKLSPVLIENYENLTPPQKVQQKSLLESKLRMSAHGMEFAALGMCYAAFALTFLGVFGRKKAVLPPLFAFLFCVLYALSDEAHQLFVPGRAFELKDLFLDSVGAFVGILIV